MGKTGKAAGGGAVRPAMIFQDSMVLQRRKPIRVWGKSDGDRTVKVYFCGAESTAQSKNGRWEAVLPPMEACENEELVIRSGEEEIRIEDVAVGEVWIAAGQSNMEFYLRYDAERKEAEADHGIRIFDYPEVSYEGQLEEWDYSEFGFWRKCTEKDLDYFTAVGYYFARMIRKAYHIPVGIIGCSWGGTPACAWMSADYLKGTGGEIWLKEYTEQIQSIDMEEYERKFRSDPVNYRGKPFANPFQEKMMYGMTDEEFDAMMQSFADAGNAVILPTGPLSEKRPGGLYQTMVRRIAPYGNRGILWYQGETDDTHPDVYGTVLKNLIRCWRDLWKEELPFLIVQLAPFEYWNKDGRDIFPTIREKQEEVSRDMPGVWMASVMDCGMRRDIHPKRKRPVGERLALLARGHVYGESLLCDPPECTGIHVEDRSVKLCFSNAGEGMQIRGGELSAAELTADGKRILEYEAETYEDILEIKSGEICENSIVEIRFAMKDYCEVNLYNSAGLPAKPFFAGNRTEKHTDRRKGLC